KRTRNPDMVCLERLQRFLEDMQERKVTVLLCGVREDFAQALRNLRFHHWLPQDSVFLEDVTAGSSTLKAVRRAYELLGDDLCPTCPRRPHTGPDRAGGDYMIRSWRGYTRPANRFEVVHLDPGSTEEEVVRQAGRLRRRATDEATLNAVRQAVQALTARPDERALHALLTHPRPSYASPTLEQ